MVEDIEGTVDSIVLEVEEANIYVYAEIESFEIEGDDLFNFRCNSSILQRIFTNDTLIEVSNLVIDAPLVSHCFTNTLNYKCISCRLICDLLVESQRQDFACCGNNITELENNELCDGLYNCSNTCDQIYATSESPSSIIYTSSDKIHTSTPIQSSTEFIYTTGNVLSIYTSHHRNKIAWTDALLAVLPITNIISLLLYHLNQVH